MSYRSMYRCKAREAWQTKHILGVCSSEACLKLSSDNTEGVSARRIIIVYYLQEEAEERNNGWYFVFSIHSLLSSSYWVL